MQTIIKLNKNVYLYISQIFFAYHVAVLVSISSPLNILAYLFSLIHFYYISKMMSRNNQLLKQHKTKPRLLPNLVRPSRRSVLSSQTSPIWRRIIKRDQGTKPKNKAQRDEIFTRPKTGLTCSDPLPALPVLIIPIQRRTSPF